MLELTNVRVTIQPQEQHERNKNMFTVSMNVLANKSSIAPNLISFASGDGAASGKLVMKMNFLF